MALFACVADTPDTRVGCVRAQPRYQLAQRHPLYERFPVAFSDLMKQSDWAATHGRDPVTPEAGPGTKLVFKRKQPGGSAQRYRTPGSASIPEHDNR